jgi:bifunctional non-homologous end joining protein LigD
MDESGTLRYRGRVEFGITLEVRVALEEQLGPLCRRTSPFGQRVDEPGAVYVDPIMPAEVRYLERTSQGRLRHPAFRQIGGRWKPAGGRLGQRAPASSEQQDCCGTGTDLR